MTRFAILLCALLASRPAAAANDDFRWMSQPGEWTVTYQMPDYWRSRPQPQECDMIDPRTSPAFAWDGHCVYGDNESIQAAHAAVTSAADPVVSLVRVWRSCPEEKRPSAQALADRIIATLSSGKQSHD